MKFPPFVYRLPQLDIPFPASAVQSHALLSENGLVAFFAFAQDVTLPEHQHKAQWGFVVAGEMTLTIDGQSRVYSPGDSYFIPSETPHSADIRAGTIVIDVFEEPDRYPVKAPLELAG